MRMLWRVQSDIAVALASSVAARRPSATPNERADSRWSTTAHHATNTAQPNATTTQTATCPMIEGAAAGARSRGAGGPIGATRDGVNRTGPTGWVSRTPGGAATDWEANGDPLDGSGPDLWCVTEDRLETPSANAAGSAAAKPLSLECQALREVTGILIDAARCDTRHVRRVRPVTVLADCFTDVETGDCRPCDGLIDPLAASASRDWPLTHQHTTPIIPLKHSGYRARRETQ
jgi:hypothetical protein